VRARLRTTTTVFAGNRSDGREAAVDVNDLAADEVGRWRGQEQHQVGDVDRFAKPPRRDASLHRVLCELAHGRSCRSVNVPGAGGTPFEIELRALMVAGVVPSAPSVASASQKEDA
jgi:hypothetical protein